jgi:cytochrome oxidase assembly protein ShyY1
VANARFLLRPRWLLSHLLVALLIFSMINLGLWQLRRLDERRERNDLIESRQDQPVTPVDQLVAPGADDAAMSDARYRRVTATGTYDDDATVVVRNRTQEGVAGAWLVTPLELASGEQVGIVRGFVGLQTDGTAVDAPPPEGEVTVEGIVVDPTRLDGTAPHDLEPLLASDAMLPVLVLAGSSTPPEPSAGEEGGARSDSILPVPPPELGEGPHFSYAVQWFIFTAIAIIGYPLVLRRVLARRGKEVDDTDDLDRELDELTRHGG